MENNIYIKNIKVNSVRNIRELEIPLCLSNRKHLILTGKNGSGKTTLLLELSKFLEHVVNGAYKSWHSQKKSLKSLEDQLQSLPESDKRLINTRNTIQQVYTWFHGFGGTELEFSNSKDLTQKAMQGDFLIAYFDAKRATSSLSVPSGIQKIPLKDKYKPKEQINSIFLQYIVNLKAERSFARDDGDDIEVKRIDKWFINFENRLRDIFEAPNLKLVFDRKKYNFRLDIEGRESHTFSELSDGHSAILSILTEIILRMESKKNTNYKMQGIVLIDEIETHLHVDLQKKILPFLSDFFPNIQFIITTHSPFVLSSSDNAVICDLQNRIVTENLSNYSYDALVESYFSSNKYSEILIEKINRLEALAKSTNLDDKDELYELIEDLSNSPKYLSKELHVKIQQIKLSLIEKKGE